MLKAEEEPGKPGGRAWWFCGRIWPSSSSNPIRFISRNLIDVCQLSILPGGGKVIIMGACSGQRQLFVMINDVCVLSFG